MTEQYSLKTVNGGSSSILTATPAQLDELVGGGETSLHSHAGGGGGTVDTSGTPVANDVARFTDANTIEGRSYAELKADLSLEIGTDVLAEQTIGIADDNLLEVDGSPNDDEFARFTANGIEGLTVAEALTALLASPLPENVGLTIDAALSADGKWSPIMQMTGTAGTNLSFGDCVYFAVADSKWELARGNAEATVSPMTGIVVVAGNEDAAVTICIMGEVRADAAFPALTVGAPVFIDPDTAGDVTSTELTTGEFQKAIGWARTANSVVLTGNPDWVKVG